MENNFIKKKIYISRRQSFKRPTCVFSLNAASTQVIPSMASWYLSVPLLAHDVVNNVSTGSPNRIKCIAPDLLAKQMLLVDNLSRN